MEVVRELMKRPKPVDNIAIACFVISVLYSIFRSTPNTIMAGLGALLLMLGLYPKQVALAFFVGAGTIVLVQRSVEGFEDKPTDDAKDSKEKDKAKEDTKEDTEEDSKEDSKEDTKKDVTETEGFAGPKPMLPDNADRKELLELGKAYKLPNEKDDAGFHLDAGTTFLNAYKALKPDQIAAMTRDTQELLATQKSLVAMLDSFGPLMKDMGKITGFFGPSGAMPGVN
jgi:hypothetical protein